MKSLKSWNSVNEAFYKYVVDPNKGKDVRAHLTATGGRR